MIFNSYEYIFLFLPIVFFVYFYLNKVHLSKLAKIFLVLSSLFFYSWWNVIYLPLILFSLGFNYTIGYFLQKDKFNYKRWILVFGVILNLSLLGFFKYTDFFIENINFILDEKIMSLNLLLPLAISFFTFQQISYLVDTYEWGG